VRVLIFSADIGEGHDLPARVLRDAVLERRPDAHVEIVDAVEAAGPLARAAVRNGAEVILGRLPWLFDLQYWLVARFPPTRRLAEALAELLSVRGLRRVIARARPDVVVSTYPGATDVLGRMRRRGELTAPLVSAITDLAALRYWSHPGCDLHLVIHPESEAEIRGVAGPRTRVVAVRGLTTPAFDEPVDTGVARASLGLAPEHPVVAVSGGGWGVGDLRGAVEAGLAAGGDVQVVALCGRNAAVQRALDRAFAGEPRVRIMGFTDRMGDVLAASDVLIHSTAGLTVFEALLRGARVISYGWGIAHIRINNEAYRRFGLADVVTGRATLEPAIRAALASPRRPDLAYGARPAAADLVLALAGDRSGMLEPDDGARGAEDAASR
jgi:UDP-N-acetylglucosamine:LPS N-acetylglucosamine transferase